MFAYSLIAHAVLFWVMFYNFYNKNYKSDSDKTSSYSLSNGKNSYEESSCHEAAKNLHNGNGVNPVKNGKCD